MNAHALGWSGGKPKAGLSERQPVTEHQGCIYHQERRAPLNSVDENKSLDCRNKTTAPAMPHAGAGQMLRQILVVVQSGKDSLTSVRDDRFNYCVVIPSGCEESFPMVLFHPNISFSTPNSRSRRARRIGIAGDWLRHAARAGIGAVAARFEQACQAVEQPKVVTGAAGNKRAD
jgi:hypothetical protein